jgi:SAM-dependent methyltransferase
MKGPETEKSEARRKKTGFFSQYMSGEGLDIGFRGDDAPEIEPVLPSAIGIDLDYPGYDGSRLPFDDESKDFVYSSHCLEHMSDAASAIQEWFRVVKKGGHLIIVVPHQFLYEKKKRLPSRWNQDHQRFYTPAKVLEEIEKALVPNTYRVRYCCDNDEGFDYERGHTVHSVGEYQIELVLQKIHRSEEIQPFETSADRIRRVLKQRLPLLASARNFNYKMLVTAPVSFLPKQQTIGLRGTVMSEEKLPASYYYSVWLRHLTKAFADKGLLTLPDSLAEIGPGDASGIGLCALLCGANHYHAFDVVRYAEIDENKRILRDLVDLFKNRTPVPDSKAFPLVEPYLDDYRFPEHILTERRLKKSLSPDRIAAIESALDGLNSNQSSEVQISYTVPWSDHKNIKPGTIDMILSQAVMEHVSDLESSYQAMRAWLKPGGMISLAIDFRSHGLSKKWNGHWSYPKWIWKMMEANRPYLLNRAPQTRHLELIGKNKFELLRVEPIQDLSGILRSQLAKEFQEISDQDLTTRSVFVQAVKTPG